MIGSSRLDISQSVILTTSEANELIKTTPRSPNVIAKISSRQPSEKQTKQSKINNLKQEMFKMAQEIK